MYLLDLFFLLDRGSKQPLEWPPPFKRLDEKELAVSLMEMDSLEFYLHSQSLENEAGSTPQSSLPP
jgi:hypothetical protein